jgi:hypothetical protein
MQTQVFEGTTEEFATRISDFAGMQLVVYAVPAPEELGDDLPAPPNAVRDQAHLETLLLEAVASPTEEVRDEEWAEIRQEILMRLPRRGYYL